MEWERWKERELGWAAVENERTGVEVRVSVEVEFELTYPKIDFSLYAGIDGLGDVDLKLELACAEMPKEGLGNVPLNLELACAKLPESEA
uniref:Uncharacterized protein n=1 Tax=Oryza meridionalis TaxID=40149 RepID=A0A0E0EFA1_9ORYZ